MPAFPSKVSKEIDEIDEIDEIVEFSAFEDVISLQKKSKNKIKIVEIHKIEVTIEVDMVCKVV